MDTKDIQQKIKNDFGAKAPIVLSLLKRLQLEKRRDIDDRAIRCILFLAKGDLTLFHLKLKQARANHRSIIIQAEYDAETMKRKRDFSQAFHDSGLNQ